MIASLNLAPGNDNENEKSGVNDAERREVVNEKWQTCLRQTFECCFLDVSSYVGTP